MVIIGIISLFVMDPVWPYHLLIHPWIGGFLSFISDSAYRDGWIGQYGLIVFTLFISFAAMAVGFKMGVWNRIFKRLVLRHGVEGELHERDIGRVYWIERYGGMRAWHGFSLMVRRNLRRLHIVDIRIQRFAVEKGTPRTVYYHDHFGFINPFNPTKSMRRLISTVPESGIVVQDSTTITIDGKYLDRDMRGFYPTFYISDTPLDFALIDTEHYRLLFNEKMQDGSITVKEASQMDSVVMKEQKKYQEISVTVDKELFDKYREARRLAGSK